MKSFLTLISIIVSVTTFVNAKNYALITGVPSGFSYNPSLVEGIKIDMSLMKNLFQSYGYQIKVLEDPTAEELRKAFKSYQSLKPSDKFVWYYSGHGGSTDDKNGDEADGKDEFIALENGGFLDDEIYHYLSKIKSKKYVFFDSCHSGTAFKSAGKRDKYSKSLGYVPNIKGVGVDAVSEDEVPSLFFFGAAKDNEQSLAGEKGSLFTVSIIEGLKRQKADMNNDGSITFDELEKFTAKHIKKLCVPPLYHESAVFTPEMHAESFDTKSDVLKALKGTGGNPIVISELERKFDAMLAQGTADRMSVKARSSYKEGDRVKFSIDTKGVKGYLYQIYTDKNEHTLLYPNKYAKESQQVSGSFAFPTPKFGGFALSAQKPYGKTTVFTILSAEPLDLYDKDTSGVFNVFGFNSSKSKKVFHMIRGREATKTSKLKIGKTVFTVNP